MKSGKMKNTNLLIGIFLIAIIAGAFLIYNSGTTETVTRNATNQGDFQEISLGMKNANYYPNTLTVKANQPIKLTLDYTVQGCFRSFVINDLGIQEYSSHPSQTIEFTPTEKGTFRFACSMGMGYGKLVVE